MPVETYSSKDEIESRAIGANTDRNLVCDKVTVLN